MFRETTQANDVFVTVTEKMFILDSMAHHHPVPSDSGRDGTQPVSMECRGTSIVDHSWRSRAHHPEPFSWPLSMLGFVW